MFEVVGCCLGRLREKRKLSEAPGESWLRNLQRILSTQLIVLTGLIGTKTEKNVTRTNRIWYEWFLFRTLARYRQVVMNKTLIQSIYTHREEGTHIHTGKKVHTHTIGWAVKLCRYRSLC